MQGKDGARNHHHLRPLYAQVETGKCGDKGQAGQAGAGQHGGKAAAMNQAEEGGRGRAGAGQERAQIVGGGQDDRQRDKGGDQVGRGPQVQGGRRRQGQGMGQGEPGHRPQHLSQGHCQTCGKRDGGQDQHHQEGDVVGACQQVFDACREVLLRQRPQTADLGVDGGGRTAAVQDRGTAHGGQVHPVVGIDIGKQLRRNRQGRGGRGAGRRQRKVQIPDPARGAGPRRAGGQGTAAAGVHPDGRLHIGRNGGDTARHLGPGQRAVQVFVHPDHDLDIAKSHAQVGGNGDAVAIQRQIGTRGFMRLRRAGKGDKHRKGTQQANHGRLATSPGAVPRRNATTISAMAKNHDPAMRGTMGQRPPAH